MDWKDALTKADEMLNSAAARVERHQLTKWFVLGIIGGALLFTAWAVFATGYEHMVKPIIKPPVVVAPPVSPPSPPPVVPETPSAPAQQPVVGGGDPIGPWVMVGVGLFFYAVICQKEREVNKDGWFARNCKPWKDDTK